MELVVENNNVVKTSSNTLSSYVNNIKPSNRNHVLDCAKESDTRYIADNEQCRDLISTHVLETHNSDTQCNVRPVNKSDTHCIVDNRGSDKCEPCIAASYCKCDSGSYVGTKVQELGQSSWESISKRLLIQIDINLLHNRCQDLCDFICQHSEHTGFITLSPLQFVNIKQCDKCIVNRDLCQDPVQLHKYVSSFKCPNF